MRNQCIVVNCSDPVEAKKLCRKHYQRWQKHGDPLVDGRSGANNIRWSGQDASYRARHGRVYSARGPARLYICKSCPAAAVDWAHKHGTDPLDANNYDPLCRHCHQQYDHSGEDNPSAKLNAEQVLSIRSAASSGTSRYSLARKYGVAQTTIKKIVERKTWAHLSEGVV